MKDNGETGRAGPMRLTSVFPLDTLSQESKCNSRTTSAEETTRQAMASGSELPEVHTHDSYAQIDGPITLTQGDSCTVKLYDTAGDGW